MQAGITPLHIAMYGGDAAVCELLLQHGASVHACNKVCVYVC